MKAFREAIESFDDRLIKPGFDRDMFLRLKRGDIAEEYTLSALLCISALNTSAWYLTKMYIDTVDINATSVNYIPLVHAARFQNQKGVEYLLAKGANVHAMDDRGRTPLHVTINLKICAMLLVAGANPRAKDATGNTPMKNAFDVGHTSLIALMEAFQ